MLHKIKEDTNPDAVAVAFDMRAPTFRHKEYDGYKAQRKGMPPGIGTAAADFKGAFNVVRLPNCGM